MSAELAVPKYPVLDDIEIPEDALDNWQITADLLAEIARVPAALVMRVHAREIEVFVASHCAANVYHRGEKAPLDTGLYCETVMSTRRKLLVPNALKDPAWDHNPDLALGMISYCGLPITWPTGELFGTLCVLDKQESVFNDQVQPLMERLRDSIQLSLANLYETSLARMQRDQAQGELRASENLSQRYLDTTQTLMVAVDTEGRVTMINRAGQALVGYTEAELLGCNWFATCLPQPEGLNVVYPLFQRFLNGELPEFSENTNEVLCRDGRRRLLHWANTPLRDDAGGIVGLLGSAEDITERKRTEQELTLFQTLVDQSNVAVEVIDPETGRFLNVNQKGCTDLGYSREELLSLTVPDIALIADPATFARNMEAIYQSGGMIWEDAHRRKDGTTFPVEASLKLVRLDRDYLIAIVHDITERKQAEREIHDQMDELQRWQQVTLGREGRVQELKREVNALCRRLGEPARYPSQDVAAEDARQAGT